jgi:hypothetical protein
VAALVEHPAIRELVWEAVTFEGRQCADLVAILDRVADRRALDADLARFGARAEQAMGAGYGHLLPRRWPPRRGGPPWRVLCFFGPVPSAF